MDRFPLDPSARYSYASRFSRAKGGHHGCDIFAPRGTPVVAVEDGGVGRAIDPKGGLVLYLLNLKTKRHYYYAHLDDVVDEIPEAPLSLKVHAGQLLGHVGDSGNAKGKAPHLHLQMRIRGTIVNPYDALMEADPHRRGRAEPGSEPGYGTRTGPDTDADDEGEGEAGEGLRLPGIGTFSSSTLIAGLVIAAAAWWAFSRPKEEREWR